MFQLYSIKYNWVFTYGFSKNIFRLFSDMFEDEVYDNVKPTNSSITNDNDNNTIRHTSDAWIFSNEWCFTAYSLVLSFSAMICLLISFFFSTFYAQWLETLIWLHIYTYIYIFIHIHHVGLFLIRFLKKNNFFLSYHWCSPQYYPD
jgi:hypothetical protein